jgi:hypothetical protein
VYLFISFSDPFWIEGHKVLQQFPKYDPTPAQLKDDVAMMYGALNSVFYDEKVKHYLTRHQKEHNGIVAWIGMLTEYDHGGATILVPIPSLMVQTTSGQTWIQNEESRS